ncbi:MAG: hypothetical protein JW991_02160 [Candidatus Pacebacteria bacterium]|nr:hypothetical protein [Candidatus Paceibacterota bacterium]
MAVPKKPGFEVARDILDFGLTLQTISVVIAFAAEKNKTDFLRGLKELIASFHQVLNDKEKKELAGRLDEMMKTKADEFLTELEENCQPDEVNQIVDELKKVTA